ncbi:MAG: non-ribosomal peptide synthetase, partial [Gemmatimonadaceae bacterium]
PARIPIGRPVANTRLYVLDAWREPVPVGVAGELCIGGVQVARGYLNLPGLAAERFVPDPFGTAGGRLYRTGDLARWLPSGELEYLGRTDFQVKIRGYRIELGEIEAVLAAHPAVQQAVVVARADGGGEPRLVAYVVGDAPLDAKEMRRAVSERLPEYMIPAGFVRLPALPLTPTGKLDRNALPAPDATSYARREYEAPNGEVEEALASIWTDVLGVERVSRHDDFFAIGGHSLLAVRVISRIADYFGVTAALQTIFSATTIARLAADVEQLVYEDIARMTDEEIDQTRELLLTNTAGRRHGDPDDDDGAS